MSRERELLKEAIETIEYWIQGRDTELIEKIKEELVTPEHEPSAYMCHRLLLGASGYGCGVVVEFSETKNHDYWIDGEVEPLYTSQQNREPLSDEEILSIEDKLDNDDFTDDFIYSFAREIEKAHGIGNKIHERIKYKVNLRRSDKFIVKKNSEQIDGKTFFFRDGWEIEKGLYKGELAMIPADDKWPKDAPNWIASGDLELISIFHMDNPIEV